MSGDMRNSIFAGASQFCETHFKFRILQDQHSRTTVF